GEESKKHELCARVTAGVIREFVNGQTATERHSKGLKGLTREAGSETGVTLPYMEIDHEVKHHADGFMSKKRHDFWVEFFQGEGISPFDAKEKKGVSPFGNTAFEGGEFETMPLHAWAM